MTHNRPKEKDAQIIGTLRHFDASTRLFLGLEALSQEDILSIHAFVRSSVMGTSVDFDAISWSYQLGIRQLVKFAESIDDLQRLDFDLKKRLLLRNVDSMFTIRIGHFFTCDAGTLVDQVDSLGAFYFGRLQLPDVAPLRWNQFFTTPWASSEQHERQFEALMHEIGSLKLDASLKSLFTIIALFQSDNDKDEKEIVDLRCKYEGLLRRYLHKIRGENEFASFRRALRSLRDMANILRNNTIKVTPYSSA